MKLFRRPLLWIIALALPVSLLPLNAQEKAPAPPARETPPAGEAAPAPEPATTDELPPDERVSADNNLSFPVDI